MKYEIFLGKNIRYLREKRNLSQHKLAEKLNIPQSTLACYEKSIRTPKLEKIIEIANFFDTDFKIVYKDLSKEDNS